MSQAAQLVTMERGRRDDYKRNEKLEALLGEIGELLGPVEDRLIPRFDRPRHPVVLVVGGPRSGSTVMMQWLASSGVFAFPSNLLSRFYRAPYVGARIQQLLTDPDYDFKGELSDLGRAPDFASDLGKTRGVLQPNDFWHFWRRFIPNKEPVWLDHVALGRVDGAGFLAELAAIESVFDKPFAMKGMILEQNIPFLSSLFDGMMFVNVRRRPWFNIQSLVESRLKFFGTLDRWYSIKPREYDELKALDPYAQVAGQVYYKNRAVEQGMRCVPASRCLDVPYEQFCRDPEAVFDELVGKLAINGYAADPTYRGPARFECSDRVRLSPDDSDRVVEAWKRFSTEDISP